jgi:transcriptional regulator of nitric oxide reductase
LCGGERHGAFFKNKLSCADRRSINRSNSRSKSSLLQLDAIHVGTVEVVVSGESIVCPKSETKLDGQKEIRNETGQKEVEIRTTTFLRAITIFITLTQVQCNAIQFIRILSTSIQFNPKY